MAEFQGAGTKPGLELWRIENMKPVPQPQCNGNFYTGDSYILLATSHKSATSTALEWHVHFWQGAESSQDEQGAAAIEAQWLDESLGGAPVQHRECQGNESDLFKSYFKSTGITYLQGGVASGFKHVERDSYRTRLLQCKGKRTVRCSEVACVAASLNTGDSFILDAGLQLFLYNGASANRYEVHKAREMVRKLHDDRGAKGAVTLLDEDPTNAAFWGALGGYVQVTSPGVADELAERASLEEIKLLRVSDAAGISEVVRDDQKNFTRGMLDSGDTYILDAQSLVFAWVGKRASKQERSQALELAAELVSKSGRDLKRTQIERVVEGAESALFKSFFCQFDPLPSSLPGLSGFGSGRHSTGVAGAVEAREVDVKAMLRARKEQGDKPVDDGTGKLETWRIEKFQKVPWHEAGKFYSGDSYVLLYTYKDSGGREQYIIYFWQGQDSSKDEVGASAVLAAQLDADMGDKPVQVRVVQGKEPAHFRSLLRGAMVVLQGGRASGFKNSSQQDEYDDDGVSLFQVRGASAQDVMGIQVKEHYTSLNSIDCFVLVTPSTVFAWNGSGSTDDEKTSALKIANKLKDMTYGPPGTVPPARAVTVLAEGEEPLDFWDCLGGKGDYPQVRPDEPMPAEPRLFHCTDKFGAFQVEEVANFEQSDLLDDDVMMLDVGVSVYLWVGRSANRLEVEKSMDLARKYNAQATDGRHPDIPIVQVKSGAEPDFFTQYFPGWDAAYAEKHLFVDPLESIARARAEEQGLPPPPASPNKGQLGQSHEELTGHALLNPTGGFLDPRTNKFALEQLQGGLPEGVDPTAKEAYLSDEDFAALMDCDRASYAKLPKWKRDSKKKASNIF